MEKNKEPGASYTIFLKVFLGEGISGGLIMLTSTMFYKRFFVVDLKTVYSTRYQYVNTSLRHNTNYNAGNKNSFLFHRKIKESVCSCRIEKWMDEHEKTIQNCC